MVTLLVEGAERARATRESFFRRRKTKKVKRKPMLTHKKLEKRKMPLPRSPTRRQAAASAAEPRSGVAATTPDPVAAEQPIGESTWEKRTSKEKKRKRRRREQSIGCRIRLRLRRRRSTSTLCTFSLSTFSPFSISHANLIELKTKFKLKH
jgi:hypothetical protein